MAGLPQGGFDPSTVDPVSFDPVPPGDYTLMIRESEMKPTKNHDGQYLQMKMEVAEGQYKGRLVWERLNLVNKSDQAREIAYRTLSAICRACGRSGGMVKDSSELHNVPFKAKLAVESSPGYQPSNTITRYYEKGEKSTAHAPVASQAHEQAAAEPQPVAMTPTQAAPPDRQTPPWMRK